jgi:hypothetical protein
LLPALDQSIHPTPISRNLELADGGLGAAALGAASPLPPLPPLNRIMPGVGNE